jgi:hypothetical protein
MKNYLLHNVLFLIGAAFLYATLQARLPVWLAAAITMIVVTAIGTGKEVYDKKHGGIFDWWDLVCDEVGGTLGILISIYMIKHFNI